PERGGRRLVGARSTGRAAGADATDAAVGRGRAADPRDRERDRRRPDAPRHDPREERGLPRGGARRDAGAELAPQALGLRRGRGPRGGAGAARREPGAPARSGGRGARRGRRRRAAAGDRGRAPHLRRGRDHHLDAPGGPVALARARCRHPRPGALRRADHARGGRPRGGARGGSLEPSQLARESRAGPIPSPHPPTGTENGSPSARARVCRKRYFLPAFAATYFATAVICASVSFPLKAGMIAPPLITCFFTRANAGLSRSRLGPTVPWAPAAVSV